MITQPYIQLNTRAKEIKQLNPGRSDQRHDIWPQSSNFLISLRSEP